MSLAWAASREYMGSVIIGATTMEQVYMYVCMPYLYVYAGMHACIPAITYIHCMYSYMSLYTSIHTYIHTYMHACIHTAKGKHRRMRHVSLS